MPSQIMENAIYQDALESALFEVQNLTAEMSHLRELLSLLEKRKRAVEEMCGAIQHLVEADCESEDQNPFLSFPKGLVALTPEEVSLITSTTIGTPKFVS